MAAVLVSISDQPVVGLMQGLVACVGALAVAGPLAHSDTWKTAIGGGVGALVATWGFRLLLP